MATVLQSLAPTPNKHAWTSKSRSYNGY